MSQKGRFCLRKEGFIFLYSFALAYIPLDPQPAKCDVLEVHRLYQFLEASPSGPSQFRRKITWFENIPSYLDDLLPTTALAEYIGTFPARKYHGNTKRQDNTKYIRTKPKVTKRLKTLLRQETVKNVERELNQETANDNEKQRNEKQLRNLKYSIHRKKNISSGANAADNIIKVEEMTKTHSFVKNVKHISGVQHLWLRYTQINRLLTSKDFIAKNRVQLLEWTKLIIWVISTWHLQFIRIFL